jgi:hypothetical protein
MKKRTDAIGKSNQPSIEFNQRKLKETKKKRDG